MNPSVCTYYVHTLQYYCSHLIDFVTKSEAGFNCASVHLITEEVDDEGSGRLG